MDFTGFPKIARLNRDIVITEKIDGTNAQVAISSIAEHEIPLKYGALPILYKDQMYSVQAGSRTRWIQPLNDNFGFGKWVYENAWMLIDILGEGLHFGEWWGPKIQRGYGFNHKRFSLFNTSKWGWLENDAARIERNVSEQLHVVPTLYTGPWMSGSTFAPDLMLAVLRIEGSLACPGFMRPEGIVVFHVAGGHLFKATLEDDEKHKGPDNGRTDVQS